MNADERGAGPFAGSKVKPAAVEVLVAGLIWNHQGRGSPIPIAKVQQLTGLAVRKVKEVVEQLRVMHRMPIGARREDPAGYFWIVDAADREAAVGPYRAQIRRMFQVLRALDEPARVRELLGQLRLQEGE
jgi:hypothetical protein